MAVKTSKIDEKTIRNHMVNSSNKQFHEIEDNVFSPNYLEQPIQNKTDFDDGRIFRLPSLNTSGNLPIRSRHIDRNAESFTTVVTEKIASIGEPQYKIPTSRKNSGDSMTKANGGTQKVDYLLFDAPSWMKQVKLKTPNANSPERCSSPPPITLRKSIDEKRDPGNLTIIHKDNIKSVNSESFITQSSNTVTAKNWPIPSTSPRSNGTSKFAWSGSDRFPELGSKVSRSAGVQKPEEVYIENDMKTELFKNKNDTIRCLSASPNHQNLVDYSSHKLAPLSPSTKMINPIVERVNLVNLPSKLNDASQVKVAGSQFSDHESRWMKEKNENHFENKMNEYNTKSTFEQPPFSRMIRSSPCSPVLERNMTIKQINDEEISRHQTRQTGLPPRPLRSPIMRMSGRSASPIVSRIPSKTQSSTQFGNGTTTSTRIDPVTGEVQHVTSRTRSYTDLNQNATVTEFEENIRAEGETEVRVVRRKTRKIKPSTNRESRMTDSSGFHQDSRSCQRTEEIKTERRAEEELHYQYPMSKVQPHRTASQTNISGPTSMTKTAWLSETNLRNSSMCKQPPMYSTYSAHKENMRRMQEQRRTEDWQASNRQLHDSRSVGSRAVLEEMETITLQPIGRGVHDLEPPTGSIARSVRANTPTANRSYSGGWDQQDGFRTIATTNYHREMHTSGPQSPYLGAVRQNSQYEATPMVNRSTFQQSESNWKTTTPFSPTGSLCGTNVAVDAVDGDVSGMRQVVETSKYWYLPGISRPDVIALLRDKEPGSFVIRNSNTYADSFGLALKIPPSSPRGVLNKDDPQSEWVRHFLIGTVPMHDGRGNGVHLRGFSSDPTFPSLAAFVQYHINRQGALPCTLRLPTVTNHMLFNQQRTIVNDQTAYNTETPLPTVVPSSTMTVDMLYLGSVEVDRLENMNAASRGIGKIISLAESYANGLPKQCEVQIRVVPHEGFIFMEKSRRSVWKKVIKPSNLLWCGIDPENREFNDVELRSKGMYGSKIFAVVARKQRFWLHENVVYVFCEINHSYSANNLVRYVNSVFPCLRD
ncbi:unnamed protein product [Heterobilharzia americana]|nr:unnamed protein product [Heterobilharzia americana]